MAEPNIRTIKRLFAVSGNRCAFPGCDLPIVEKSGTVTGEIAHIKAASPNGPRYDSAQTDDKRHGYENLILLCRRHHAIVDSEPHEYPASRLLEFKKAHEQPGAVEITPKTGSVAEVLLTHFRGIVVQNGSGNVAVNSPGAMQAQTINIKSTKSKVTIAPPDGSISGNREMRSYIEYLIARYQDYQKQDKSKADDYKYMALHNAIKREFTSRWQLLSEERFEELVAFLKRRIDNSKIGRIRKSHGQKRYHSFEEHR